MTDVLTPEQRRFNMSRIRSRDTGPEVAVRKIVDDLGFTDYEVNTDDLPGKPDIVFRNSRLAIWVHGCYFHRHSCPLGTGVPKTNVDFWSAKFEQNVRRDAEKRRALRKLGWRFSTVWACELRNVTRVRARLRRALKTTRSHERIA
jgi:DNA mismatch endonuclease (patch repair protein)